RLELGVGRVPDVGSEQPHASRARSMQADDLAQQHRLPAAASAHQRDQVSAPYAQVDALVHDLLAEVSLQRLDFDHRVVFGGGHARFGYARRRVAHSPSACSSTANSASSTMTTTIDCTTVEVVLRPIERASRLTVIPIRHPITAIA